MTGKICIRLVGALTCIAMAATGWDAEAGWRRHHRQSSCCCEPVYSPCCEPVCETVCAPVCVVRTVEPSCCCRTDWGSTVVQETVIVPARSCCDGGIVTTVEPQRSPVIAGSDSMPAPTAGSGTARNVSVSSSVVVRPATTR